MSRFYGTLTSDKGQSTRAGHHWIRATAQSYGGSISVTIGQGTHAKNSPLFVTIRASERSTDSPEVLIAEVELETLLGVAGGEYELVPPGPLE